MALPALDSRVTSKILFVAEGPFAQFAKQMKVAYTEKSDQDKTTAIVTGVISLFQTCQEATYEAPNVKTWVLGVFKTANIRIGSRTKIHDQEIRIWTVKALNSQNINAKICRSFQTVFKKAALKQIDQFYRTIDPDDFEWEEEPSNFDDIIIPSHQEAEGEGVIIDPPLVSKENWVRLVEQLRSDPSLLL